MATEITSNDFTVTSSDVTAHAEASLDAAQKAALDAIRQAAASAKAAESQDTNLDYSMHEVNGIGRYVIPRYTGWKPLLKIIHDPVPNIDFSANIYPAFDGVIGERFQSPYLLDPLHDKYESYESLRDNLAAVRNFLLQTYFANTPDGITKFKAEQALNEIATFVGDGLYNNWKFAGVIPHHTPGKPFISLYEARKPNGEGAQYIYERILEMQRQSSWMRPFSAVVALFGGKQIPNWNLPDTSATHFTDFYETDITDGTTLNDADKLALATDKLNGLDAKRQALRDARILTTVAVDLDAIGNHLLYTAGNMVGVAHISDPVRRDAVDIAKDILKKLKVSLGDKQMLDGLKLTPNEDMAVLGSVKGVAMVYERLLAWARANNDAEIFKHPSIIAATQAIGQLGYVAKHEASRMASVAGNSVLAENIDSQIKRLPAGYTELRGASFGNLLDRLERGIDTVINRIQEVSVSGAKVGFSAGNELGSSSVNAAPTAGIVNHAATRNAQAAMADQLAAQAEALRMNSQLTDQARRQQMQAEGSRQAQPTAQSPAQQSQARNTSTVGRQAAANARSAQRQSSSAAVNVPTAPNAAMTPAQMQAMQRNASLMAANRAAHDREDQLHTEQNQRMADQARQAASAKAAARAALRIDPSAIQGFKQATNMAGVTGAPVVTGRRPIDPRSVLTNASATRTAQTTTPPPLTTTAADTKIVQQGQVQPPIPPTRGGGRGF
jgi:hypothetical protein